MSWGQNDGDGSVRWSPGAEQQFGPPPWHLWGNSQRIHTVIQSPTNDLTFSAGQLVRIAYKRPETWHWLFSARLIDGPDADAVDPIIATIHFDLTVGIGRSMVQIPATPASIYSSSDYRNDPTFETLIFQWGGAIPGIDLTFPRDAQLYSTASISNRRLLAGLAADPATAIVIDQIVAQDIQLQARVQVVTTPGSPFATLPVELEVSAHFAPVVHVRPDWFQQTPGVARFPGGEVGGK